jgi:hypothetical protein
MKLDPAVVELLRLDPERATVSSAGGGGCSSASTSKITCKLSDGTEKNFFMKTGKGEEAEVMFAGMTQRPFFAYTNDCARRTRVAQSHPRRRAFPLSSVIRPRPLLLPVFNLVPRDRLLEPRLTFCAQVVWALIGGQAREASHDARSHARRPR